jgi:hypothetical protein
MSEASRVRVQHPAATQLTTPSDASHQTTARTSWRGPIGTPQFFHLVQQPRTDDNAQRDVQKTMNSAFAPLFFLYGFQQRQQFFLYVNDYATPTRSVPEMERPRRAGVRTAAAGATARTLDSARNGPQDSPGARQKCPALQSHPRKVGACYAYGEWPRAQAGSYVRRPSVGPLWGIPPTWRRGRGFQDAARCRCRSRRSTSGAGDAPSARD